MQVNVYEAKTRLSALLEQVASGGPSVVIARSGKPIARLVAIAPDTAQGNGVRFGGFTAKQLKLAPDFHAPVLDDELLGS